LTTLILGLALFLGVHSISIVAPDWRDRTAARMGARKWQAMFGLVATAGLILVVWGYALARQDPVILYVPPVWLRHLVLLLMVPVFPLLLAAYLPGRIQSAARHPMLAAVKLWALAHLLANGTLADLVLFGSFLVWSVTDRISWKWRAPRATPGAPPSGANDIIAVVAGLLLYTAFVLWLHRWLIGVAPVG
jgi:uncharacterized membrane protein